MLTVTHAAEAVRISRLGALAQRQGAIEAMSRIDTLLTDKTGTLTTQEITFGAVEPIEGIVVEPDLERVARAVAASTAAPDGTTTALRAAFRAALVGDPLRADRRQRAESSSGPLWVLFLVFHVSLGGSG